MKPIAMVCVALSVSAAALPAQVTSTLSVDSASAVFTYSPIAAQAGIGGRVAASAQVSLGRLVPGSLTIKALSTPHFPAAFELSLAKWLFVGPNHDTTVSGTWSAEIEFRPLFEDAYLEDRSAILLSQRTDGAGNGRLVLGPDPTQAKRTVAEPRAPAYRLRAFEWAVNHLTPPINHPAAIVCVGYLIEKERVSVSNADLAALAKPRVAATSLERCPPTFAAMIASSRGFPPGDDPHTILIEELVLLDRGRRDWVAITFVINHGTGGTRYYCRIPAEDETATARCRSGTTWMS
jgi:hypothetical protein